jgi:hypothetical protein
LRSGKKPSTPLIRAVVNHDNDSLNDEDEMVVVNKLPPAVTNVTTKSSVAENPATKKPQQSCNGCETKCSLCDVEGTSAILIQYFEGMRSKKIVFHQQWKSLKTLKNPTFNVQEYYDANEDYIQSLIRDAHDVTAGADSSASGAGSSTNNTSAKNKSKKDVPPKFKHSELAPISIHQVLQTAMIDDAHSVIMDTSEEHVDDDMNTAIVEDDSSKSTGKSSSALARRNFRPPSEIDTTDASANSGATGPLKADEDIDSSFFIGKPIRLFCTAESAYHTGRIIDWREQPPVRESSNYNLDLSATRGKKRQSSVTGGGAGSSKKKSRISLGVNCVGDGSIACFYDKLLKAKNRSRNGADGDFFGRTAASANIPSSNENGRSPHDNTETNKKTNQETSNRVKLPSLRAEFLVRFKAGTDGRKVAVHQWLVLEEHAISVGVGTVWGYAGAGEPSPLSSQPLAKEKWRPATLHLRSALEMVPMSELNAHLHESGDESNSANHSESTNAMTNVELLDEVAVLKPLQCLCFFFGQSFVHAVLKVKESCVDFFSNDFETTTSSSSALKAAGLPPPSHATSLAAKQVQKSLAVATTMACMEMHEQRRLRQWHKLDYAKSGSLCSVETVLSKSQSVDDSRDKEDDLKEVYYVPQPKKSSPSTKIVKPKSNSFNVVTPIMHWSTGPSCIQVESGQEFLCSL